MRDITNEILELIRRTSSSLPKDVEERLRASIEKEEPGSAARGALETISRIDSMDERRLLLSETLDCCSHRLDAWITATAS